METISVTASKSDATRERILAGAVRAFAARGYEATPLSAVAETAGATQSLIHYHFSSKRDLWRAVQRRILGELVAAVTSGGTRQPDDLNAIEDWCRKYFEYLRRRPELVRLAAWLELDHVDDWKAEPLGQLIAAFVDGFRKAQIAGHIRRDVDAVRTCLMLQQMLIGWFRAEWIFAPTLSTDAADASLAYLEELLRVIRAGLAPIAEGVAPGEPNPIARSS